MGWMCSGVSGVARVLSPCRTGRAAWRTGCRGGTRVCGGGAGVVVVAHGLRGGAREVARGDGTRVPRAGTRVLVVAVAAHGVSWWHTVSRRGTRVRTRVRCPGTV